jgi:hypothetical protein
MATHEHLWHKNKRRPKVTFDTAENVTSQLKRGNPRSQANIIISTSIKHEHTPTKKISHLLIRRRSVAILLLRW